MLFQVAGNFRLVICISSALIYLFSFAISSAEDFEISGHSILPGTKTSFEVNVPSGSDEGTFIPVTIFHGSKPGPVLALVAGVHGTEYTPIIAGQRLAKSLNPVELSGTVILVQIANVPQFLGRSVYFGPVDRKNLNRVFPGRMDGTLSERIAYMLTNLIFKPSDYVVDIHCGDSNESLRPWVGYYGNHGTPEIISKSKEMAIAFDLPYIVSSQWKASSLSDSVYSTATSIFLGKPSIDIEVGQLGETNPKEVLVVVDGIFNLMKHVKMLQGEVPPKNSPFFIENRESIKSEYDGIFYPLVKAGDYVPAGMKLGKITDFYGNIIQEIEASQSSVVLMIYGTPPVRKAESVVTLGLIPAK
jgi:predicted deacylase